jgi:endonuclease G, mitochondrial
MILSAKLIKESSDRLIKNFDKRVAEINNKSIIDIENSSSIEKRFNFLRRDGNDLLDVRERVLGNNDLLQFNYFERATNVGKAVGRVIINDNDGVNHGYGTGFLISNRLFITNNHVLPTESMALNSQIQFNFELDINGQFKQNYTFETVISDFFFTNKELDFTVLALKSVDISGSKSIADFGYIPLIPQKGKILLGEYLSIIQHPDGKEKQIAIRENKLIDHTSSEDFIWYKTDTSPGSSGSPVFNDQWQLVALHHSGVPDEDGKGNYLLIDGGTISKKSKAIDSNKIKWKANEGVRASRIFKELFKKYSTNDLFKQIGALKDGTQKFSESTTALSPELASKVESLNTLSTNENTISIPVLLNITPQIAASLNPLFALESVIKIAPDIEKRKGYDPDFLKVNLSLTSIAKYYKKNLAILIDGKNNELKYEHFSVLTHSKRRMPVIAAANFNGIKYEQIKNSIPSRKEIGSDKWYLDERLDSSFQLPFSFYKNNPFDVGHIVKREEPVWGNTDIEALRANNDTFHLTNACPQHSKFNQGKELWLGVENHLLFYARENKLKATIFSGPVLNDNDRFFETPDGLRIQIPSEFFKVIVYQQGKAISALGFVLSQYNLIDDLTVTEAKELGDYNSFAVRISSIEEKTKLDFGLNKNDAYSTVFKNINSESTKISNIEQLELFQTKENI